MCFDFCLVTSQNLFTCQNCKNKPHLAAKASLHFPSPSPSLFSHIFFQFCKVSAHLSLILCFIENMCRMFMFSWSFYVVYDLKVCVVCWFDYSYKKKWFYYCFHEFRMKNDVRMLLKWGFDFGLYFVVKAEYFRASRLFISQIFIL